MEQKIIIPSSDEEQRIDKFVLRHFPQYSRAYLKKQIKQGNFLVYPVRSQSKNLDKQKSKPKAKSQNKLDAKIKYGWTSDGVNNKKVKPSYILRQGDQVALAPGFALPEITQILPNSDIKLNIIYEDANILVINKPAGLAVHPRQNKNGQPLPQEINNTLVSGLLAYCPSLANVGDNPTIRPGLVHRLDKDTSGVMIAAKNQSSFNWLKNQFKERKTAKKYLALVHGSLKNKKGKVETLLHRASSDPTKQKVSTKEGKEAITQYKTIKEFDKYALLEVTPKTGRLHQIRVHLAHLGHPIACDAKYGDKRLPILPGLTHQFLHAQELEITLPASPADRPIGQKRAFSAPLPADLHAVLNTLEKI